MNPWCFFLACDNGCVCLFGRPWFSFSGRQSIQCCYALKTSESSKRWVLISMHLHRESIPLSALCSFLCICEFRFMYSCTFALLYCNWNLSQSNYRHFAPLTSILLSPPSTTRRNVSTYANMYPIRHKIKRFGFLFCTLWSYSTNTMKLS